MATNPFEDQINQLNGQTAADASIQTLDNAYFNASLSDEDTIVNEYLGFPGDELYNPGVITVVNADYTPAYMVGSEHAPPVFGVLSFSSVLGSTNFSIIGFTADGGILLTSSPNQTIETITSGGATVYAFNPNGTASALQNPLIFETNPAAVCFAEGTRIDTVNGSIAVEHLAEGDLVHTASGATRPIKWIGMQVANPGVHPQPQQINPVLVRAHAFGHDVPSRDVRLSPGHAVFVDGVLVPIGYLINGATVIQLDVETVRYYHIELASHDVLLAEGLPCESYLDDGNRQSFLNSGEFTQLHGRLDPKSWDNACAPLVAAGPQLIEIRQRLHVRAEELGWKKCEEADLALMVDGAEIAPLHRAGNRFWFSVPVAAEFTLCSTRSVLAHVIPGLNDRRKLGVAVSALRFDGEVIDLDNAAFGAGFYPIERHEQSSWRWTDGKATIAFPLERPAMFEIQLVMVAPSWRRAAPQLRIVAL